MKGTLMNVISVPYIIEKYRINAHELGLKNHNREVVNSETYKEFFSPSRIKNLFCMSFLLKSSTFSLVAVPPLNYYL